MILSCDLFACRYPNFQLALRARCEGESIFLSWIVINYDGEITLLTGNWNYVSAADLWEDDSVEMPFCFRAQKYGGSFHVMIHCDLVFFCNRSLANCNFMFFIAKFKNYRYLAKTCFVYRRYKLIFRWYKYIVCIFIIYYQYIFLIM